MVRITHKFHPLDHEHSEFIAARQREILTAAGAVPDLGAQNEGRGALEIIRSARVVWAMIPRPRY